MKLFLCDLETQTCYSVFGALRNCKYHSTVSIIIVALNKYILHRYFVNFPFLSPQYSPKCFGQYCFQKTRTLPWLNESMFLKMDFSCGISDFEFEIGTQTCHFFIGALKNCTYTKTHSILIAALDQYIIRGYFVKIAIFHHPILRICHWLLQLTCVTGRPKHSTF